MVNHPNGLLDPLVVAVNNPRILHFLVRAAAFKNPLVKKFLGTLNLMPIYRIRDGVQELGRNQEIFENCFSIFKKKGALMIFPEGSHNRKRTIRPLSKGFTRILYGTLEKHPEIEIKIVPVGITYQSPSVFPSNISVRYGKPILANPYYSPKNQVTKTKELKEFVSNRLQELSVHTEDNKNYEKTIDKLNKNNVDFTDVTSINQMIQNWEIFHSRKRQAFIYCSFLKPIDHFEHDLIPWLLMEIYWQEAMMKLNL